MNENDILKPCPCCGSEAEWLPTIRLDNGMDEDGITCTTCPLQMKSTGSKTVLALMWNARASASATEKEFLHHLKTILKSLGSCLHTDHHGNCQDHFLESPCSIKKAEEFLTKYTKERDPT